MTDADELRQAIEILDAAEYSPVDMLELRSNPAYAIGYQEGWDDAPRDPPPPRRDRLGLVAVVAAGLALLLAGIAIGRADAAPRSAPDPVMTFEDVLPVAQGPSGVPHVAPLPSSTSDPGPAPAAGYAPLGVPQVGVRVATRPCPCPVEVTGGTPPLTGAPASAVYAGGIRSPLQGVQGLATWYCCTRGHRSGLYAAAGPALRVGHWRGRVVEVCSAGGCLRARLIDACLCRHGRVIDLYPEAFRHLAPLSVGVIGVTVSWSDTPRPPATDTQP